MEHTPTCQELIARLDDFLDGELDPALCDKIQQHLAECPYCHSVADTLQTMLALYRGAPDAVPRDVHTHLLRVLGLARVRALASDENTSGRDEPAPEVH
jgi:anti-sigma factor (TIGR02949 family)